MIKFGGLDLHFKMTMFKPSLELTAHYNYVSGKLPTFPSPKPPLTLNSHLGGVYMRKLAPAQVS